MSVHATPIGPVDGVFTSEQGGEMHLSVVAFAWNDASFNTVDGYWAYGEDLVRPGVQYLPANSLKSLAYHNA